MRSKATGHIENDRTSRSILAKSLALAGLLAFSCIGPEEEPPDLSAKGPSGGATVLECGEPSLSPADTAAMIVWRGCDDGRWHVELTAGGGRVRYAGTIGATRRFLSVTPVRVERGDSVDRSAPRAVDFEMNVSGAGRDGVDFTVADGAEVTFDLAEPGSPRVLVGPRLRAAELPATLTTGGGSPLPRSKVFRPSGDGRILGPDGRPIMLCGYRVQAGDYSSPRRRMPLAEMRAWAEDGLLGNAQGVEIWWSNAISSPGEGSPHRPGEYNEAALEPLLDFMRDLARAGTYIIPSIRVSYDQGVARERTAQGIDDNWADHVAVINNDPVRVTSGPHRGTYGNHRDRFFAWVDWLVPRILADEEIADAIAYWEIWHYPGHRHPSWPAGTSERLLDDLVPALMRVYRRHDPDRLLGVPLTLNSNVNLMNARLSSGRRDPYAWADDPNWIMVVGGYGRLDVIMRPDNFDPARGATWPTDSRNPEWLGTAATGEFNTTRLRRLCAPCSLHSQEGPGLRETFRLTPIPALQRTWLRGVLNHFNETTNGFGFHAWPPSWEDLPFYRFGRPDDFDETQFFSYMRTALAGDPT